jgi:hypothetical protein
MPQRICRSGVLALLLVLVADAAGAQTYSAPKARRKFVTVSYDSLFTKPLHFLEHPVEDLVGRPVAAAQFEAYDYRTRDGEVLIDVLEFSRRSHGAGIALYPFGVSVGPALALRASFEDLPIIRIAFAGTGAPPDYALAGARAYDLSAAIVVADHSPGWGLGSHAFVGGGIGRIKSVARDGDRIFGEGGGGLNSGPIGVELSVKFAWNHFTQPVDHRFLTVPVTVRGTLTF